MPAAQDRHITLAKTGFRARRRTADIALANRSHFDIEPGQIALLERFSHFGRTHRLNDTLQPRL